MARPSRPSVRVDGVGGTDDDEVGQHHEEAAERDRHFLEEGNIEGVLDHAAGGQKQRQGRAQAEHRLGQVFGARRQPLAVAFDHLEVIVHPADDAEAGGHADGDPDVAVAQVGPEQRRDNDGDQNQRAAHGRCAGLAQMGLRAVAAHRLADLILAQRADQPGTKQQGHAQGRQHTEDGAQRQILQHAEAGMQFHEVRR